MKPTVDEYLLLASPALMVAVWQYIRLDIAQRLEVPHAAALEGAKLLREWCTWLATIATGAIGVTAFVPNGTNTSLCHVGSPYGALSVTSFALSIIITATLLLALPSLAARFVAAAPSKDNDFYESTAFAWAEGPFGPFFRVGYLAFAQYYFFVAGIVGFATCASAKVAG